MSGRYAGYLLCTDLDGTLMNSAGKVSPENAAAIRDFQQNGGLFTVSTGRAVSHMKKFNADFEVNAPMVTCNGAYIYDGKTMRELFRSELFCPATRLLPELEPFWNSVERVVLYSDKQLETIPAGAKWDDNGFLLLCAEEFHRNTETLLQQKWMKVLFSFRQPEDAAMVCGVLNRSALGADYNFSRSWPFGVEMLNLGATKGDSVCRLKKMLPEVRQTVCMGDYENDMTMLRMADIGIAVANAPEQVRAAAKRVTVSNDESAVAQVISELPVLE